jgi:hypothetical protein
VYVNGRFLRFENGQVTSRWRDSAHGNKQKVMTLDALEFMRRFLLHVLPRGFVKIRHFGLPFAYVFVSAMECEGVCPHHPPRPSPARVG